MAFLFSNPANGKSGNRFAKACAHLFVLGCFLFGVYFFLQTKKAAGPLEALLLFARGAFAFAFGLLLLIYLYLPELIVNSISKLLMPNRKLEKPPLMLSPIQGKITAGRVDEALEDLLELTEKYPNCATISLMLHDLYLQKKNDPEQAFTVSEHYLKGNARTPADDSVSLVMRCTDFCIQRNEIQKAVLYLRKELEKSCYSERERGSLLKRLNSLED